MNSAEIHIRAARPSEAQTLSQLAIASKAFWGYSDEQMGVFKAELTMSAADLQTRIAYVAELENAVAAFYTLLPQSELDLDGNADTADKKTAKLDDLFVAPTAMGKGCGRHLFAHACARARLLDCERLLILSDPHAAGFYEKMGCQKLRDIASSIPGRTIPLFCFDLV